jgi:hypothetical protein
MPLIKKEEKVNSARLSLNIDPKYLAKKRKLDPIPSLEVKTLQFYHKSTKNTDRPSLK